MNLAARLMCAAAKSEDKDVYVESGIERATSVSPQARLCVFTACEPIKSEGFAEMVKVFSLEARARPSHVHGSGFFFEFELWKTSGPSSACHASMASSRDSAAATPSTRPHRRSGGPLPV